LAGSDSSTGDTPYHWSGEDLILAVVVQPRASHNALVGIHGDRIKVRLTAPPVEGKANQELIKFIAKLFGVAPSRVTLQKGKTAKIKILRINHPANLPDFINPSRK
jgi:uncharacterized protein (TIGR00251 family)